MKTFRKWIVILMALALVFAGAWFWGYSSGRTTKVSDEAVVLIEQVKAVTKMIAVEATLSEIYEHSDFWGYDLAPFRKKALVRVKAKVSIGYDLEELSIITDEATKTITIYYPPRPEILSIDQDLDYYDLTSGWLNSFDEKALSDLQSKARTFIEQKVRESDLFSQAGEQREKWLRNLEDIVELAGWNLVVSDKVPRKSFNG